MEWIDVENDLCHLRAQKSPAEIEVIRHTYHIAEVGFQAAIDAIEVGVTERAVAAEIEAAMRRAGAEGTGIDTIVASGPNTRPILARSTFRPIECDDLVLLTIAPRYEGYHAAIGRVVLVGNPGQEIKDALFEVPAVSGGGDGILHRAIENNFDIQSVMGEVARHYLTRAMTEAGENKSQAAELLGLGSYQTVKNWIQKYGLEK